MKKSLLFLTLCLAFSYTHVSAQLSEASAQKLKKAIEVFNSGKFDKAIADAEKILKKEPAEQVWGILARFYMLRARNRHTSLPSSEVSEALTDILLESLWKTDKATGDNDTGSKTTNISIPSRESWEMKKFFARGLYQTEAEYLWIYYRNQYLDREPQKDIDPKAMKIFEKAEENFEKKNYNQAIDYYREALEIQPDFYKASLYLGDSYYLKQDYDSAIKYFTLCKERFPDEMEPAKYLTDACYKNKQYEAALEACIDGLILFPEKGMISKLELLAQKLDKNFNYQWVRRGIEPAKFRTPENSKVTGAWKVYLDAAREAYTKNTVAGAPVNDTLPGYLLYPEVYAWKKMLESEYGKAAEFTRARQAMDAGYLEPYVLLIQYHCNFHPQWLHYKNSPDNKIRPFFKEFLLK